MNDRPAQDDLVFIGTYDPNDPQTFHLRPELDPANANAGTERGDAALERSLEKYGAGRSVLLDADNVDIAGNKTLQKWVANGGKVAIVETDGKTLVAVRRRDLRLMEGGLAQELAIADNRTGELNLSWDYDRLVELKNAGYDLADAGFTHVELEDIEAHVNVPSLEDLDSQYGPQVAEDGTVTLTWRVSEDLRDRVKALLAEVNGDDEQKIGALVAWAEDGKSATA